MLTLSTKTAIGCGECLTVCPAKAIGMDWDTNFSVFILRHMMINTQLSKFINAYKSASSRLIKKEYQQIRKSLWKECFWSRSFCLLTTGGAPLDVIKKYIESQGEKL